MKYLKRVVYVVPLVVVGVVYLILAMILGGDEKIQWAQEFFAHVEEQCEII